MKKLIIGITGSIAAFKTVQFISDLVKEKYEIEVMLTTRQLSLSHQLLFLLSQRRKHILMSLMMILDVLHM